MDQTANAPASAPETPKAETKAGGNKMPLMVVIAIVAIVGVGGLAYGMLAGAKSSGLKDGTYTAEGDYVTHVGTKKINVKVTLKNGVIADADVTNEADDKMSAKYQDTFIGGYKEFVIGKKITDVHVGKVSGSSLTPVGFNNALQKIEAEAK